MKGGFYGMKVTQVSVVLIGFVCLAVLMLAWTKNSFTSRLTPGIPLSIKEVSGTKDVSQNTNSSKLAKEDIVSSVSSGVLESSATEPSAKGEQTEYSMTSTVKDCNFGKGKWVIDDTRPLYSGLGCKQWLSSMWACRMTQRTDFEYEKLHWRPRDCDMEEFTGPKFLGRNSSIWQLLHIPVMNANYAWQ